MSETVQKLEALKSELAPLMNSYNLMLDSQREAKEVINNANPDAPDYASLVEKYNLVIDITENQFTDLKPKMEAIVQQMELLK